MSNTETLYYMVLIYEFSDEKKPVYLTKTVAGTTLEELEKIKCEKIKNEPLVTIINEVQVSLITKNENEDPENYKKFSDMLEKYKEMKTKGRTYQAQDIFINIFSSHKTYENTAEYPCLSIVVNPTSVWVFYKDFIYKTGITNYKEDDAIMYYDLVQACYFGYGMEQLKKNIKKVLEKITITSADSDKDSISNRTLTVHDCTKYTEMWETFKNVNSNATTENLLDNLRFAFQDLIKGYKQTVKVPTNDIVDTPRDYVFLLLINYFQRDVFNVALRIQQHNGQQIKMKTYEEKMINILDTQKDDKKEGSVYLREICELNKSILKEIKKEGDTQQSDTEVSVNKTVLQNAEKSSALEKMAETTESTEKPAKHKHYTKKK